MAKFERSEFTILDWRHLTTVHVLLSDNRNQRRCCFDQTGESGREHVWHSLQGGENMYAGSVRVSSMVKYTVHMYRFICMIYLYVHSHGDEIQHVLINEIDVEKEHGNTTEQVIHKLVAAPVVGYSRNSPHIAECFGPYMNSKVRNYG